MRFMNGLLQVVFFLVVVSVALLVAGLITNKLPWTDSPGVGKRLMTYLSTNIAETAVDSPFPELRPRAYAAPAAFMFDVTRRAAKALKWELTNIDAETKRIEAVVTTQVIGFKDDVTIRLEATGEESSKKKPKRNILHYHPPSLILVLNLPVTVIVDKRESLFSRFVLKIEVLRAFA